MLGVAYGMVYLLRRYLLWMVLSGRDSERIYQQVKDAKLRTDFLGFTHSLRLGIRLSEPDAARLFKYAADRGIVEAMFFYAVLCFWYNEIPANFEEAFKYFSMAAERDHPESVYYLGRMYFEGKYVTRDPFKAFEYFERAVELNVEDTKAYLGFSFFFGIGAAANHDLGLRLLKSGLDAGNQISTGFYSGITGQKL
jgi:TPR repeat protein